MKPSKFLAGLLVILIVVGSSGIGLGVFALLRPKTATGPVLGLGLTYANGQLVGAQAVGQTKSMDECRKLAKAALASVPIPAGTKLGCAQVEIQ